MRHFLFLVGIAAFTLVAVLFFQQPDMLEEIWLWIVGLIGLTQ